MPMLQILPRGRLCLASYPTGWLVLFVCLMFATSSVWAQTPIRIASLPLENREATFRAFTPLTTHLQHALQQPVEMVYLESNRKVVDALEQGLIDIAMLGPLPYVAISERNARIEPLVFFRERTGEVRYRCVLVAFSGDDITIAQLRGRRLALTQPLSTCGYLGSDAILRQQAGFGLQETYYQYLGDHEAAALAVVAGRADAAGVKDEFAYKFAPLGLVVIGQSDWVPAVGLFAHQGRLSRQQLEDIRQVLLATPAEVYQTWGHFMRFGMARASDTDFDVLRAFGNLSEIPQEGVP